ncbi:DUF1667 domain-containing protein [Spirochaeta isovalerica]|uniref:CxxC motif-containing protein n=1 Tax=Spirochaeta isovalerica TaxID=150 RepID=A0A841RGW4_9SPIO|nr:DUF1667 domain-containing protein [Spirochaeta isovalerica]MBB6481562.1 CxxC motif-containing protein [Spirochaeta isovalerica]
MTKELICISCPMGCHLEVTQKGDEISVKNNKCSRGEIYGKEELLAPKRVVTATCPVKSALMVRIPVKTTGALPKELINSLLEELYRTELKAPVNRGDIILSNFRDSGVDVVSTKTLPG